jgi:hypothetical protein
MKLSINNQCLDIDLVSPTYRTYYDVKCYIPPARRVNAGDIMITGFIIGPKVGTDPTHMMDRLASDLGMQEVFCSALMYKLQKRRPYESTMSDEDKSSSTIHLLIVWKFIMSKLHADMLLIKHDEELTWNRYNLGELNVEKTSRIRLQSNSATSTWSLDDNTALRTTFEITSNVDEYHILNINIDEVKKDKDAKIPAWIDSK